MKLFPAKRSRFAKSQQEITQRRELVDLTKDVMSGLMREPRKGAPKSVPFEASYNAAEYITNDPRDAALLDARKEMQANGQKFQPQGNVVPSGGHIYYDYIVTQPSYHPRLAERRIYENYSNELKRPTRGYIHIELGPGNGLKRGLIYLNEIPDYYIGIDFVEKNLVQTRNVLAKRGLEGRMSMIKGDFGDDALWETLRTLVTDVRKQFGRPDMPVKIDMVGSTFCNEKVEKQLKLLRNAASIIDKNGMMDIGYDRTHHTGALNRAYSDNIACDLFFYGGLRFSCSKQVISAGTPRFEDFKHGIRQLHERTNLDTFETVQLLPISDCPNETQKREAMTAATIDKKTWVESVRVEIGMFAQRAHQLDGPMPLSFKPGEIVKSADTIKYKLEEIERVFEAGGMKVVGDYPDTHAGEGIDYGITRLMLNTGSVAARVPTLG